MQACVGDTSEVEQERAHTSNSGWRTRVEQLGRGIQLYVGESKVPTLEVVIGRGVAGEKGGDWPNRRSGSGSRCTSGRRRDETNCGRGWRWASRGPGVSRWGIEVDITGTVGTTSTHDLALDLDLARVHVCTEGQFATLRTAGPPSMRIDVVVPSTFTNFADRFW